MWRLYKYRLSILYYIALVVTVLLGAQIYELFT